MKRNKLWVGLLGLLTLTACNKDLELATPTASSEASQETKTEIVNVQMGVGQDVDGLRVMYNLDASGAISGLAMSDKDVVLRVVVRRLGGANGTEYAVNNLTFRKEPGRNYATYSGQIEVPTRVANTDRYEVAAALMSEVGGETFLHDVDQQYKDRTPSRQDIHKYLVSAKNTGAFVPESGLAKLNANIPYITDWQSLTLSGNNVANKVTLKFKPYGTVLRVRIKNATSTPTQFDAFRFLSTAFTQDGVFNFYSGTTVTTAPDWEAMPFNATGATNLNFVYTLPEAVTLAQDQYSPWYYTVVYPRKTAEPVHTVAGPRVAGALSTEYKKSFETTVALPFGSVPVTLEYTAGNDATFDHLKERSWGTVSRPAKLAIEYVAPRSFNLDGSDFVSDDLTSNAQIGRFTYAEAKQKFGAVKTIAGVNYSLPTREEMASIFPDVIDVAGEGPNVTYPTTTHTDVVETNIKIGATTATYLADYSRPVSNQRVLYAIRFRNQTDEHRTAFRYRRLSSGGSTYLQVDCYWLGQSNYQISDVAKPTFWTEHASEVVSRVFPLYGVSYDAGATSVELLNSYTGYWTSTTLGDAHGSGYAGVIYSSSLTNTEIVNSATRLPVRPFIRN